MSSPQPSSDVSFSRYIELDDELEKVLHLAADATAETNFDPASDHLANAQRIIGEMLRLIAKLAEVA